MGSTSANSTPSLHTPPQSVVPPQPATPQSHNSNNTSPHTQPQKTPQSSPIAPPKQQSPIGTNTNPATQPSIPAAETHQPVSSSPPQHVAKSANGEGVKSSKRESRSSAPDEQLCFRCKKPGHPQKDCPEQPYCSKCRTKGHVPAWCPSKQQGNRPNQEGHEFWENNQSHETRKEEWKKSQDQPQFSHRNNKCLHCASDHQSRDCPMRQQHRANTTSSPASGPGIYRNTSQFLNTSPPHTSHPQQHFQQSQSTVGITTPTLPVTNPPFPHNFQHPPPVNQQSNYQVCPPHFQQFTQSQVSPLQTPPQPFNPQIPPPYFPQYPPSNSPSVGSNDSSILAALQKQEKQERLDIECFDMERQKEERKRMKEEWEQKKEKRKRLEKWKNQQPIPAIALIGWNRQKHWLMNTKEEYTEKNCYSTVAPV